MRLSRTVGFDVRAAGAPAAPPSPPSGFGSDLRNWMTQPGDQVLTLPGTVAAPVTYTAGTINAVASAHATTTGTYKGWLVLEAQEKGGVIVDLSSTGWHIGSQSNDGANDVTSEFRILFVGVTFRNGLIQMFGGRKWRYWYCDFTFPTRGAGGWEAQWEAAGGTLNVVNDALRNSLANYTPAGFRIKARKSPYSDTFGWYGCDFHGHGDDGIYMDLVSTVEVRGCNFWDQHHHGVDPGTRPNDYFHSDAIQHQGGSNVTVADSYIGGHMQIEAGSTNITNFTFSNLWSGGSPIHGATFDALSRSFSGVTVNTLRWFANGQYTNNGVTQTVDTPHYDANFDAFQSIGNGAAVTLTSITHGLPSGVTVTGGLLDDLLGASYPNVPSITNHASNPANVWRNTTGHGLADWATFFSGNWP